MTNQECQSFFERYANLAMDQQQKYGIPASVTLSQMALESSYGTSRLAREGNNYFGVKAYGEWIKSGKPVGYYSDDRPNEPFRHYASAEQSLQDHSKVLMLNNYKSCQKYDSTDYHNWLVGIKSGGYATDPRYVTINESIIEKYHLDRYDQLAKSDAEKRGISIGYLRGKESVPSASVNITSPSQTKVQSTQSWALPVAPDGNNHVTVTSDYGQRNIPVGSKNHKGIDIGVSFVPVYATECHGKVVEAGYDRNGGGNFVKIEYERPDNVKYQVACLHLSQINVKVGDIVEAGQQIGVTGNSGVSTGPHLDFRVKRDSGNNNYEFIDPKEYLADVCVRGNISTEFLSRNGNNDLLAEYKSSVNVSDDIQLSNEQKQNIDRSQLYLSQATQSNTPSDWLKYLMMQNQDDSHSLGFGGDLISELAGMVLKGLASLGMLYMAQGSRQSDISEQTEQIQSDETHISSSTLIERKRSSVNPEQARQLASMNYESLLPDIQQVQSQRLA